MNISKLEENAQAPYLLTKDGILGVQWSYQFDVKKVVFHPINKNGTLLSNNPIKVHEDDILIKHIDLDLVNQKAIELLNFQEFKNVVFDISSIFYKKLGGLYLSNHFELLENEFKKMNLKFIHLENLDKYILVDSDSKNKNLEIKSLNEDIKHIIGVKGKNIERIKIFNDLKYIKVIGLSFEEHELILKRFEDKFRFLFNYINMQ